MATVTIGTTDYPSFASLAYADNLLAADAVRATAWALRNDDAKGRGLVTATRILLGLGWCGDPPTVDDAPDIVQQVTSMLAADGLSKTSTFSNPSGALPQGVKIAKAGSASVEFFGAFETQFITTTPIPADLWNMLKGAGLVGCGDSSGMSDGAYVSGINPAPGEDSCDGRRDEWSGW